MCRKLISFLLLLICIVSCSGRHEKSVHINISLPETTSPRDLNPWGVTKFSNLKLREEPRNEASPIRYITRGVILEVIKRLDEVELFDGKKDYWYYVSYEGLNGWIFGSYIDLFNTKDEAEKRCEDLLFNTQEKPEESNQ